MRTAFIHPALAASIFLAVATAYLFFSRQRARAALKEQAARSAAILDAIPHPLYVRDTQCRFVTCNTAYELAIGACRTELVGMMPDDIETRFRITHNQPDLKTSYEQLIATGRPIHAERTIHAHGKATYIYNWAVRLQNQGGNTCGLTGGWVDVTDWTRKLSEMRMARASAEHASKEKSILMTTLSHELRTPLNALVGMLELLRMRVTSPEKEVLFINTAYASATSLLRLIDDALDWSKLDAGKLNIRPEPVDLRQIIAESVSMFTPVARESNLFLTSSVAPEVAIAHMADPARLRQIINNLISNALKFTPSGGVEARLWVQDATPSGQVLLLAISDTGIGIASHDLPSLFRPFHQAESTAARVTGGTGLGLSICQRLARKMGGDVTLQSELGVGTTVEVALRLPLSAKAAIPVPAIHDDARAKNILCTARILVIDDHPANRLVLLEQLRHLGCQVSEAASADQALDLCHQQRFEMIFCDVNMPVTSGYAFARCLRSGQRGRLNHRTPILGYTASTIHADHQQALAAGMQQCLVKPLGITTLHKALLHHLPNTSIHHHGTPALPTRCGGTKRYRYDPDKLQALTMGNKDSLHRLVASLLAANRQDMQVLDDAIAEGNLPAIAAQVHRIKGAADLIGAEAIGNLCRQMESVCRTGGNPCPGQIKGLRGLMRDIQQQLNEVLDQLRQTK